MCLNTRASTGAVVMFLGCCSSGTCVPSLFRTDNLPRPLAGPPYYRNSPKLGGGSIPTRATVLTLDPELQPKSGCSVRGLDGAMSLLGFLTHLTQRFRQHGSAFLEPSPLSLDAYYSLMSAIMGVDMLVARNICHGTFVIASLDCSF